MELYKPLTYKYLKYRNWSSIIKVLAEVFEDFTQYTNKTAKFDFLYGSQSWIWTQVLGIKRYIVMGNIYLKY